MEWSLIIFIVVVVVLLLVFKFLKLTTKFLFKGVAVFLIFLLALYVYDNYVKPPVVVKELPKETIEEPLKQPTQNVSNKTFNFPIPSEEAEK